MADSLSSAPIVYVFVYVADFEASRRFYGECLDLPLIERDGWALKFDAGTTLLGLNRASDWGLVLDGAPDDSCSLAFHVRALDAVLERLDRTGTRIEVSASPSGVRSASCYDPDGHRCVFREPGPASTGSNLQEPGSAWLVAIQLGASSLDATRSFYADKLGLGLAAIDPAGHRHAYRTGDLALVSVLCDADVLPAGRGPDPGIAPVFFVPDVARAQAKLTAAGVRFDSGAHASDIGVTAEFRDPNGHKFYLYAPSDVALSWSSGERLAQLVARSSSSGRASVTSVHPP